jgi:phosphoribosylanthranilate isomerase
MRVKICGVRTLEAAEAVAESGADFAGLNFVPASRRAVSVDAAKRILARLGGAIPVGVFADQPIDEITRIARALALPWIQLHGNEAPDMVRELSKAHRIIKAIAVRPGAEAAAAAHAPFVDLFLFDGPAPGSGKAIDWARLPRTDRPFLLAGGLTPANVKGAIEAVRPFGVDVASGVETGGDIARDLVASFVANARFLATDPVR